jgi:hypothetical protein
MNRNRKSLLFAASTLFFAAASINTGTRKGFFNGANAIHDTGSRGQRESTSSSHRCRSAWLK